MIFKKKFMTHKEIKKYNNTVYRGIEVFKAKIPIKNIVIGAVLIGSSFIIPDFGLGMLFGICIMSTPNIKQGLKDGYFLTYKSLKLATKVIKNKYNNFRYKNE